MLPAPFTSILINLLKPLVLPRDHSRVKSLTFPLTTLIGTRRRRKPLVILAFESTSTNSIELLNYLWIAHEISMTAHQGRSVVSYSSQGSYGTITASSGPCDSILI